MEVTKLLFTNVKVEFSLPKTGESFLVTRPHYPARSMRFRSRVPRASPKCIDREAWKDAVLGLGKGKQTYGKKVEAVVLQKKQ